MSKPSCEFLFHVFVSKAEGPMVNAFPLGLERISPFDGPERSVTCWALEHLNGLHEDDFAKQCDIDLSDGHLWEIYGRGRIDGSHDVVAFADMDAYDETFTVLEFQKHDHGILPEVDIDDL